MGASEDPLADDEERLRPRRSRLRRGGRRCRYQDPDCRDGGEQNDEASSSDDQRITPSDHEGSTNPRADWRHGRRGSIRSFELGQHEPTAFPRAPIGPAARRQFRRMGQCSGMTPERRTSAQASVTPAKAPIIDPSDGGTLVAWASCARSSRRICRCSTSTSATGKRTAMAAFPPRERDAFMAHWAKTLADDSALTWTVVSRRRGRGQHRLLGGRRTQARRVLDRARVLGPRACDAGPRGTPRRGRCAPAARVGREEQRRLDPRARQVRVRQGWRTRGRGRDRGAPPGAAGMSTDLSLGLKGERA